MPVMETLEETGCIGNIPAGVEHGIRRGERFGMVAVIDLHAAKVNQPATFISGLFEGFKRLLAAVGKDRLSLDIECPWMQRPLAPGFRQPHRQQDRWRHAMLTGCTQDFRFADTSVWR